MLEVNALLSTSCPAEKGMNKKFFFKTHKMAEMDLKNEKYKKKQKKEEEKKQIQKYFSPFSCLKFMLRFKKASLVKNGYEKYQKKKKKNQQFFILFT